MEVKRLRSKLSENVREIISCHAIIKEQQRQIATLEVMQREYNRLKSLEQLYTKAAYAHYSTPERILKGKQESSTAEEVKHVGVPVDLRSDDLMTKFQSHTIKGKKSS